MVGLITIEGGRVYWDEETRERLYGVGGTMTMVMEVCMGCGHKVWWHVVNVKHFCPQPQELVYFSRRKLVLD